MTDTWTAQTVTEVWAASEDPAFTFSLAINPTFEGGTGGTFDGVHNDLDGRSTSGAHPISAITGLQAALDAMGAEGRLPLDAFVERMPVDRGTYATSYPVADLRVILAGQADSAENGLYLTTTGGALDLSSYVDIFTLGNVGRAVWSYTSAAGPPDDLWSYIDDKLYELSRERSGTWFEIGPVDGGISLIAPSIDPDTLAGLVGTVFAPAMSDFSISTSQTLSYIHCVNVYNGQTEPIDIVLAKHGGKVRFQSHWNKGAYDVNLSDHPEDTTTFARTLAPGERVIILPDQADWDVWHQLPQPVEGTAGYVVAVASDEERYELVPGTPAGDLVTLVGTIDASTDPNWPAANAGDAYRVQFPGKLGGPLGVPVEANDMAICWTGAAAGTNAEVGDAWLVHADPRGLGTAAFAATGDFAAASHSHAASAISSGTLDIARIPTGTSSTTVAVGDDARFAAAMPGSILVQYGLDGSYTTGTAISHFSYSLPAMLAGDWIEVEASLEWNNTTGSNVAFAPNLVLDSTVMTTSTTATFNNGSTRQVMVRARLQVISTSSQTCDVSYSASLLGATGLGTGVATVDVSAAGKALSLRTTTNNASAGAKVRFATITRFRT